jgi:predicted GNAT superfamily acetyltransferase
MDAAMPDLDILPIDPADPLQGEALLRLNNDHAEALSPLTEARWAELAERAFLACRVGTEALLLAFDQDAQHDSPNFQWFRQRLPRFLYIDRIVVGPRLRGQGVARALYAHLFSRAVAAGHDRVVCEINARPPNPVSDAFHQAMGFAVIGSAEIYGGSKLVRYFSRSLTP